MITFVSLSCSNENEFVEIGVNNQKDYKSENLYSEELEFVVADFDGNPLEGKMKITIDDETGDLVSLEMTQNLIDGSALDVHFLEVSNFSTASSDHSHKDCIKNCNEQFTDANGNKLPGRGKCKLNCWGKTIEQVAEAIVYVFALGSGS